ncbi:MAG: helix-turn-helix domain-containing protein [Pseudonocardiaceae bacterium]
MGRRRGLSLDVVAGLTGIGKQYLSMLELGQRGFNRRGLVEDLANALGCSVADLTGQPYLPPDRESARAKTVIAQNAGSTRPPSTMYPICSPALWMYSTTGRDQPWSCGTPPATGPRARASTMR